MSSSRNDTLLSLSTSRGIANFCTVAAGSAAFIFLLSLGAYHYLYKGVPSWGACAPIGTEDRALSFNEWNQNKGRLIFKYFSPFQSTIHIRLLTAKGIELLTRDQDSHSGQNSIALDTAVLKGEPPYTLEIECCGRHAEQVFALK
jgi:hypothetical protein